MSSRCNRFVQNAWKKELCSNCFKPREEHAEVVETSRLNTGRALTRVTVDSAKPQSILKGKTSSHGRKKVAFPESLAQVIGYGGDDFSDSEEFELSEPTGPEDDYPDGEEERALSNLTRANTNFNTVTANLSGVATPDPKKSFASLMLGKPQKDSDGKKKTLLVSVTPFGGDDSIPTAKRPSDKKVSNISNFSKGTGEVADSNKSEVTLKSIKNTEEKILRDRSEKETHNDVAGLEKIVDMPLITSSNLISVIQKSDTLTNNDGPGNKISESFQKSSDHGEKQSNKQTAEKRVGITRTPAIKKPINEKPKISLQNTYKESVNSKNEYIVTKSKETEYSSVENSSVVYNSGIELTLMSLNKNDLEDVLSRNVDNREKSKTLANGKDVNKITVTADDDDINNMIVHQDIRKVEGEAATDSSPRKFSFEDSRELAGEPDGKADEEVSEPPALPRSPPPVDMRLTRNPLPVETRPTVSSSEARTSFLHGGDKKTKPAVPQKPASLPSKPIGLPKSPTSSIGPSFKKNLPNNYVLPPPSIRNAALQSANGQILPRSSQNDKVPLSNERNTLGASQNDQSTSSNAQNQSSTVKSQSQNEQFLSKAVQVSQSQSQSVTKTVYHSQSTAHVQSRTDHAHAEFAQAQSQTDYEAVNVRTPSKVPASPKPRPPPLNLNLNQALRNEDDDTSGVPISPEIAAELIRSPNKRRMAPKPPAANTPTDEIPGSLFARNPGATVKSDSPVVREKEKRERASSCSPKFRKPVSESPEPSGVQPAETSPRRVISLSQDSLANPEKQDEKKKGRSRFSLKKFLRMGSKKDVDMTGGGSSRTDEIPTTPQPKPRLEIIHPLELDGAAVEVVSRDRVARLSEDVTDSRTANETETEQSQHITHSMTNIHHAAMRPGKPPPPPRNQSLDDWSRLDPTNKPARPPPPRGDMNLPPRGEKPPPKPWQPTAAATNATATAATTDSIYANLAAEGVAGEVRSALAPSKPQRTASMRDPAICQPPLKKRNRHQDYETLTPTSDSPTSSDSQSHADEFLSSSPECDLDLELRHGNVALSNAKRKSDSSALDPANDFKYHHQPFTRSTSLPYCGSETESELYAPYSFYTGDEGPEEDQDWKNKSHESKVSRLRQRRGRSIVHRSLEDNYGAVVVANHEALAQVLEQLNQASAIPSALRGLKTASLRLSDFTLDTSTLVAVGRRTFYSATDPKDNTVTLCIALDPDSRERTVVSRKEFYLVPITVFTDMIPEDVLGMMDRGEKTSGEATIWVLPHLQVSTIKSFATIRKNTNDEGVLRESAFVLLQLVNALRSLQNRGIEEARKSLNDLVLCREGKDACYRLYLLQGLQDTEGADHREEEKVSLCQCALIAMRELLLTSKLPLIQEMLTGEKAVTLTQVKSVLEYSLWGPADVTLGGPRDREIALQRWLDLERATVLHALVRTRSKLTVTDEYHLLFLVRTSAKIMSEASILLDARKRDSAVVH